MNNWREDAQPEWPVVASATQEIPVVAEDDAGDPTTRAFPVPSGEDPGAARPETLRLDRRYRLTPPTDATELLPRVDPTRADPTRAFPQQAGGAGFGPTPARGTNSGQRSDVERRIPDVDRRMPDVGSRAPERHIPDVDRRTSDADSRVPEPHIPERHIPERRIPERPGDRSAADRRTTALGVGLGGVDAGPANPAAPRGPWRTDGPATARNAAATTGHAPSTPGHVPTTPGHAPTTPGRDRSAPGRAPATTDRDPGVSGAPGRTPAAPGHPLAATDTPTTMLNVAPGVADAPGAAGVGSACSVAPRDPWQQDLDAGAHDPTVDPHEVTVQLDAVQLGDGLIRRAATAAGGQEASDGPVFVDESGRRSRHFRRLGMAVALACAVYAVVIVATLLSGSSDAPWLPVPGQKDEQPAGKVDTTPLPTPSTGPTGATASQPGTSLSPGASDSPLPGTTAGAPGVTADPDEPGADPEPTATRSTPRPGTGGGADPAPTKTTPPAATEDPEPTPDPTGPTAEPTETAGGDPVEADTVAAGPGDTEPAPASTPEALGASSSPSPEYVL